MSLKCGIVGLPNVGKSTLFNALTNSSTPAENYSFCTIDPHFGIVQLPDPRMKYFNAASDPLIEPLLKATKTYNDNDCSSIDIYKTIKSLAETITNIPNIENNNLQYDGAIDYNASVKSITQ